MLPSLTAWTTVRATPTPIPVPVPLEVALPSALLVASVLLLARSRSTPPAVTWPPSGMKAWAFEEAMSMPMAAATLTPPWEVSALGVVALPEPVVPPSLAFLSANPR